MPVMKEWSCFAHGSFENRTGKCPHGCSKKFVVQEFRTPPGVMSGRTHNQDRLTAQFAKDFGLPDVHTSRDDGKSVMQNLRRDPTHMPSWGEVPHAKPGFSERKEAAPTFSPTSYGAQPDNVMDRVRPLLPTPKPMIVNPPQANNRLPRE